MHSAATERSVSSNLQAGRCRLLSARSELASSIGTGSIDLTGAILLIEDLRHVGIGQVDRNAATLGATATLDANAGSLTVGACVQ